MLDRSASLAEEDVLEHKNAVVKLHKALANAFPSVFSKVEKSKQISQRTGIEILDKEQIDQRIRDMKAGISDICPNTERFDDFS